MPDLPSHPRSQPKEAFIYFAEAKGPYWQVIHHDAPMVAIPGLEVRTAHRQCHPACKYDRVEVDFISSHALAWVLAEKLNLGLARLR